MDVLACALAAGVEGGDFNPRRGKRGDRAVVKRDLRKLIQAD